MTITTKHHVLIGLSLGITLSVFHTVIAAEKTTAPPAKVSAAKTKPVEIKTYTIIGHADTPPVAAAPAKPILPQFAAKRFGPGQFGFGGRPWNLAMGFGTRPGSANAPTRHTPTHLSSR